MSMKFRFASLLSAILVLPLFFISTGSQHQSMASPMPEHMSTSMDKKVSDCLSACGNQYQPTVTAINQREVEKEKEPKPAPAEPYYLAFMGVGWSLILLLSVYLLRHLHWRPPDLYKLNSVYRI